MNVRPVAGMSTVPLAVSPPAAERVVPSAKVTATAAREIRDGLMARVEGGRTARCERGRVDIGTPVRVGIRVRFHAEALEPVAT